MGEEYATHVFERADGWVGFQVLDGAKVLFSGKADTEEHAERLAGAYLRRLRAQDAGRVGSDSFNREPGTPPRRKAASP